MKKPKRILALLLAAAMLLPSCGGGAKATSMHLRKTEGKVSVSDGSGKDVEPREDLGLYSGYGLRTRDESYAWIDLDEAKLTKMDQETKAEIQKDGKDLEIIIKEGALFFNVTQPLADDETMTIRASSMLVGIRGTCGWVEAPDDGTMKVFLLEGKVRCEADGEQETVRAGEMAAMTEDGEITVSEFTAADVPAFVMDEIEDDDDLAEAILDDSGIDLSGGTPGSALAAYQDALDKIKKRGKILYTEMVDFEADGNPELLVIHTREDITDELFAYSIFRSGPDGSDELLFAREPLYEGQGIKSKFSLVESGGRMYLETCRISDDSGVSYSYTGSIAEKDGVNPSWSGDDRDWTMMYWISERPTPNGDIKYSVFDDFEDVGHSKDPEERYHEIRGKFSPVKVLAYSPDGESLIISPEPPAAGNG